MKRSYFLITSFFLFCGVCAQNDTTKSYLQSITGTNISFKMVAIPASEFTMGSNKADKLAEKDELPPHTVSISAFWMGAYEVTYDEFNLFAEDESITQNSDVDAVTRPSQPYIDVTLGMGKTGGYPANSMQQYGALMYCRWLYRKTGIFFRLPTEAEWEYACDGGAATTYPFGEDAKELNKYAWYKNNSDNHYHKVGELQPNKWGLYDMLGNVAEWTMDQYDETAYLKTEDNSDPVVLPTSRHPRTVRGGSYRDETTALRTANRLKSDPVWNRRDPQVPKSRWWNADAPFVGFRIIRPVKQPTAGEAETFFKTYLNQ